MNNDQDLGNSSKRARVENLDDTDVVQVEEAVDFFTFMQIKSVGNALVSLAESHQDKREEWNQYMQTSSRQFDEMMNAIHGIAHELRTLQTDCNQLLIQVQERMNLPLENDVMESKDEPIADDNTIIEKSLNWTFAYSHTRIENVFVSWYEYQIWRMELSPELEEMNARKVWYTKKSVMPDLVFVMLTLVPVDMAVLEKCPSPGTLEWKNWYDHVFSIAVEARKQVFKLIKECYPNISAPRNASTRISKLLSKIRNDADLFQIT